MSCVSSAPDLNVWLTRLHYAVLYCAFGCILFHNFITQIRKLTAKGRFFRVLFLVRFSDETSAFFSEKTDLHIYNLLLGFYELG